MFLKGQVDVLSYFDENQLRKITPDIERKTYMNGQKIVLRGMITRDFYIIKKGKATATAKLGDTPQTIELKPGDFFGELSLIESAASDVTIVASEDGTEVLTIPHNSFQKLVEMQPVMKKMLQDKITARRKPQA